jgi:hypothetical protein
MSQKDRMQTGVRGGDMMRSGGVRRDVGLGGLGQLLGIGSLRIM